MAAIQTDPQYKLRLPADLKALLEEAATEAKRSLNAEIVHRLHQTFQLGFPYITDEEVEQYGGRAPMEDAEVLAKMDDEIKRHSERMSVLVILLHRLHNPRKPDL